MSQTQNLSTPVQAATGGSPKPAKKIDPRGPRFGSAITVVVLALAVVLGPQSPVTLVLLLIQTAAFALGGLVGLQFQPYGFLFRKLVRPRLAPPAELEDSRPPQFAQLVGLVFVLVGLLGYLSGISLVFYVAVVMALSAALLNTAFNLCLGCEVYLLVARLGKKA